jgi:hypothetical protein
MKFSRLFAFGFALAVAAGTRAYADDAKPIRHLVYDFDVTLSSSIAQESYSGTSNASGSNGDRGQIVADVMAVQPDTGLVVKISENARNTRSAEPAMCVTYGNGQFVCESDKKINEEEYTLLRLLGKNFVNHAEMDAKNHWTYGVDSPAMTETSNYTIDSQKDGILNIAISRDQRVKGAQGYTAQTQGRLTYNEPMNVPVADTEDTVTRQEGGASYNRLEQQISLRLVTDSMAQSQTASH